MTHPNARFWAYLNGGPVKITLRPGQVLNWTQGQRTDEGWSRSAETWSYDLDVLGIVERHWCEEGRDCDGLLQRGGHDVCCPVNLHVQPPYPEGDAVMEGVLWPDWQEANRWQQDSEAEKAGY
jgi:hypothetical protein